MTIDFIAGFVFGASVILPLRPRLARGTKTRAAAFSSPLTTATNHVVVTTTKSALLAERLQQLFASGAPTQNEYACLANSPWQPEGERSRVSILDSGPNKIRDIKVVRESFQFTLRDVKAIVDNLPQTLVTPMTYAKAMTVAQHLESTGMTIHLT
jgi:ribosomal protein L7/L12